MRATRIRSTFLAGVRGLALVTVSLTASVVLSTFTVVSLALIPIGIGLFTTPVVLTVLRGYTGQRRLLAAKWSDVRIRTRTAGCPPACAAASSDRSSGAC